jgi:hypothetical protein
METERSFHMEDIRAEELLEATDAELAQAPPPDPEIEGSEGFAGEEA